MTEYEMASLANELNGSISTSAGNAFSTVTAFLVVGYLAAHKLNRFMVLTAITVYTVWLSGAVLGIVRAQINLAGLIQQMHLMAEQGKGLQWHLASRVLPEWYLSSQLGFILVVFTAIYIASVIFFFQSRRVNRKAEPSIETPKV
jgi:hypothetical protein